LRTWMFENCQGIQGGRLWIYRNSREPLFSPTTSSYWTVRKVFTRTAIQPKGCSVTRSAGVAKTLSSEEQRCTSRFKLKRRFTQSRTWLSLDAEVAWFLRKNRYQPEGNGCLRKG
jgi:hypothetical protein